jgi:1-aminocyclopropane-1-carboxylate deaminase/D-cysteine desulfhydrase-like pyridoxal-dependent ACC family enzyme
MLFDINNIIFQELESTGLHQKGISLTVARLDKIHPIVSGNKLFKLHYFLEAFATGAYKTIQTFGGAYSNHLVATAFACKKLQIPCKGIIRGEKPATLSSTLQQCSDLDMQLEFLSRRDYAAVAAEQYSTAGTLIIPEGGYHPSGAKGAALIMEAIRHLNATHICLAVGTATTLAGILQNAPESQKIIAVPVLKGFSDIDERLNILNGRNHYSNLIMQDSYHFGGYAKKTTGLLHFMNKLYQDHRLPTDFVYTAKLMYAVSDMVNNDHFLPGSRICCLHTGGLQGNNSLPPDSLIF